MTAKPNLNKRYGLTEVYQHDLDKNGVCKKCHKPVSKLKLKICPVIGREEVALSHDPNDIIRGDDGGY